MHVERLSVSNQELETAIIVLLGLGLLSVLWFIVRYVCGCCAGSKASLDDGARELSAKIGAHSRA
jgi:hypothetical protein